LGRRLGLEQEIFLVEPSGLPSARADEFLAACRSLARPSADARCPEPECVTWMVEAATPPATSLAALGREYLASLELALRGAREVGLRLYPFATYPLPVTPRVRDEPRYRLQARVLGEERFLQAGRCAGVHLHLELPPGVLDRHLGVSPAADPASVAELLGLYNLATALDPALLTLSRSSPFFEGLKTGLAARAANYRGHKELAPDGLYADLPAAGALLPYATSLEELADLHDARNRSWAGAVRRSGAVGDDADDLAPNGLAPDVFAAAWNPVRLNGQGTVEIRTMDSNLPEKILAACALAHAAAERVRREGLRVVPDDDAPGFVASGDELRVPGFDRLGGPLQAAALREGARGPLASGYLDSVVEFGAPYVVGNSPADEALVQLVEARRETGFYPTTEAEVLAGYAGGEVLSREEGLSLVLRACDRLEAEVYRLAGGPSEPAANAAGRSG